jgi:pyridoxal phosphate enzyme (YggS family)
VVAITKTFGLEYLQAAYGLGIRHFGENRVAEAAQKLPSAMKWLAGQKEPTWHMVGHLQRRKVGDALGLFDLIHSVDSLRLAERIDRLCQREGRRPMPVLLEVDTSGEPQKFGFHLDRSPDDPAQWSDFLTVVEQILQLPSVEVRGFMTMAPLAAQESTRPCFRRLREVRSALSGAFPEMDCGELSMGMSNDFEVAVEEGATMLRLGQAIFGPRERH